MLTDQLLSEIEAGHGKRLAVAARILPSNRQDKPVTLSCLLRWVLTGVRLPSGERVQLEAARIAGKWVTTPQALRRFVESQTPRTGNAPTPSKDRTTKQRQTAADRAGHRLQEMGA